jgi:hypothetical protein
LGISAGHLEPSTPTGSPSSGTPSRSQVEPRPRRSVQDLVAQKRFRSIGLDARATGCVRWFWSVMKDRVDIVRQEATYRDRNQGWRQRARQYDDSAPREGRRRGSRDRELGDELPGVRAGARIRVDEHRRRGGEGARRADACRRLYPDAEERGDQQALCELGLCRGRFRGGRQRGDPLAARSRRLRRPKDSHRCARAAG